MSETARGTKHHFYYGSVERCYYAVCGKNFEQCAEHPSIYLFIFWGGGDRYVIVWPFCYILIECKPICLSNRF